MEDAFIVRGGRKLQGTVRLSGAKNVALKVIIASLMFDHEVTLQNIPRILDVYELMDLIKFLGGKAEFTDQNTVVVDGTHLTTNRVDLLHGSKIRVSFMLFAPLLYRFQECFVPNPGGCRIGARPIDRIVEGMKKIGIAVNYDSQTGYYKAKLNTAPTGSYTFPKPTHTGTELLILLSLMTKSTVTIHNAASEPEIDELMMFLDQSGAKIKKNGTNLQIEPMEKLSRKDPFAIGPDRNEAVTFATLALATKGRITIPSFSFQTLDAFIKKLKEVGAGIDQNGDSLEVFYYQPLKSSNVETAPHPGFMTDWQPNWAVLMTQAQGESTIHERVFENRFSYVDELRKLGAEIDYIKIPVKNPFEYFFFNFDPAKKYNQAIRVKGPQELHGGVLTISDLRAGATLAIAALAADGESVVNGASIMERGYENFVEKVKALGGDIEKI